MQKDTGTSRPQLNKVGFGGTKSDVAGHAWPQGGTHSPSFPEFQSNIHQGFTVLEQRNDLMSHRLHTALLFF